MTDASLLRIENLTTTYRSEGRTLRGVRDVSFDVRRGQVLGIAGEGGSGKSTLSLAISRLLSSNAVIEGGRIDFDGTDLAALSDRTMRALRGTRIAMIFQDPLSSLHPCLTVGRQIWTRSAPMAGWPRPTAGPRRGRCCGAWGSPTG